MIDTPISSDTPVRQGVTLLLRLGDEPRCRARRHAGRARAGRGGYVALGLCILALPLPAAVLVWGCGPWLGKAPEEPCARYP